jgi:CRISPR-associated protein Cas1
VRLSNALYITDHRAKIGTSKSTLRVTDEDGTWTRVPMESLDAVVLLSNAQITSQALAACVRRGIHVTSLSRSGRVRFQVRGDVSGNVELRRAQVLATLDDDHKLQLAQTFVAGKLQNARLAVQRWRWDAPERLRGMLQRREEHITDRLNALGGAPHTNHVRGLEGEGTRQYFRSMGAVLGQQGWRFDTRTRRPPRDPVNALLSFTYALVTSEVVGALTAIGLDPQIGYLHEHRPGRPALALDVLEELRVAHADRFTVRTLTRHEVITSDFEVHPGGAVHLTDDGRRSVLSLYEAFRDEVVSHGLLDRSVGRWALPHVQATLLARHLRGDVPRYAPYVMR